MAENQWTPMKPNKFNEIFSTANNFLGPARAENPFIKESKEDSVSTQNKTTPEAASASHSA
jgi:hypothetical protein